MIKSLIITEKNKQKLEQMAKEHKDILKAIYISDYKAMVFGSFGTHKHMERAAGLHSNLYN